MIALAACGSREGAQPPAELVAPKLDDVPPDQRSLIVAAWQAAVDFPGDTAKNARLGMLLLAYDQPAAAVAAFKRAALSQPDNFPWLYYLGQSQAAAGQSTEALVTLRKAAVMRPAFIPLQAKIAALAHPEQSTTAITSSDPYMQALRDLRPEAKIVMTPDERPAHFEKGRDLMAKKQFAKAIAELKLTLTPEDQQTPGYLFALSRACALSGDLVGAVKYGSDAKQLARHYGQTDLVTAIVEHLKHVGDGSPP